MTSQHINTSDLSLEDWIELLGLLCCSWLPSQVPWYEEFPLLKRLILGAISRKIVKYNSVIYGKKLITDDKRNSENAFLQSSVYFPS